MYWSSYKKKLRLKVEVDVQMKIIMEVEIEVKTAGGSSVIGGSYSCENIGAMATGLG